MMALPDLNLLRMFLILWDERSVSRAAERAHVTQSAMSHILKRLRTMLGDPLFRRGPRGLEPTAYAIEIEPRLRAALQHIPIALERAGFEPARSERRFLVAAGPYMCELLVPAILARVAAEAPLVGIGIVKHGPRLLEQLESGAVDLAIGCFDGRPARIAAHPLFREEMVWVARRGHGLRDPVPDERLRDALRVEVSIAEVGDPAPPAFGRSVLQARTSVHPDEAPARPPHMVVYDNRTALDLIAATDLIGMLPRRLVERHAEAMDLRILSLARGAPTALQLSLLWSQDHAETPGHQWLRALVVEEARRTAASLPDAEPR